MNCLSNMTCAHSSAIHKTRITRLFPLSPVHPFLSSYIHTYKFFPLKTFLFSVSKWLFIFVVIMLPIQKSITRESITIHKCRRTSLSWKVVTVTITSNFCFLTTLLLLLWLFYSWIKSHNKSFSGVIIPLSLFLFYS